MLLKRYISINYIYFRCILFTETVLACVADGYFLVIFSLLRDTAAKAKPRSTTPTKTNCIEIQQLQIEAGEVSSVRWTKLGLSNNKDTTNTVNRIN